MPCAAYSENMWSLPSYDLCRGQGSGLENDISNATRETIVMAEARPDPELLVVANLVTGFPGTSGQLLAVNDVSLTVRAGETVCLVGESGSGKSLTALSILRLVPPPGRVLNGSVRLRGRELLTLQEDEMCAVRGADISLIFQEPMTALNPVITVGDQIAESLVVHGRMHWRAARAEAVRLMEAVRIPDAASRARDYPHQLSGGQRQRVLIAMALACKPALVIADEPTTALDVTIQAQILDLMRELQREHGLALLLITHDLGVVAEMADRVVVMYAGRVVEEAPVEGIFTDPQHPYTRGLLASLPKRRDASRTATVADGRRLQSIEGVVPTLSNLPPGCAFEPRCSVRVDVCREAVPELIGVSTAHSARCVHVLAGGTEVPPAQVPLDPANVSHRGAEAPPPHDSAIGSRS
jgi:peptide/nickel transport system ATP-binding protein